jgi:hypothetical protein
MMLRFAKVSPTSLSISCRLAHFAPFAGQFSTTGVPDEASGRCVGQHSPLLTANHTKDTSPSSTRQYSQRPPYHIRYHRKLLRNALNPNERKRFTTTFELLFEIGFMSDLRTCPRIDSSWVIRTSGTLLLIFFHWLTRYARCQKRGNGLRSCKG